MQSRTRNQTPIERDSRIPFRSNFRSEIRQLRTRKGGEESQLYAKLNHLNQRRAAAMGHYAGCTRHHDDRKGPRGPFPLPGSRQWLPAPAVSTRMETEKMRSTGSAFLDWLPVDPGVEVLAVSAASISVVPRNQSLREPRSSVDERVPCKQMESIRPCCQALHPMSRLFSKESG